jgi:hypothetical protein
MEATISSVVSAETEDVAQAQADIQGLPINA